MLSDLERQVPLLFTDAGVADFERREDGGEASLGEGDVHHWTNDLIYVPVLKLCHVLSAVVESGLAGGKARLKASAT
jgi:hypothetical protein